MGYARGGERLVTNITKDWQEEFIEGHDFVILSGEELVDFKELLELTTKSVGSSVWHLLLLFEPGLNMALAKTNKPAGRRLRRFIADEVLPQIARDGKYLPERSVRDGKLKEGEQTEAGRRLALAEAKETRLSRQMEAKAMRSLVKILKQTSHVSEEVVLSYEISAIEAATGRCYSAFKPVVKDSWRSPTEIAKGLGVTTQRVGLTVTELNLRGNHDGLSMPVMDKARGSDKTVICYRYSPKAVGMIADKLSEDGLITKQ